MSRSIGDRLFEQLEGFLIPLEKRIQEEIHKPGFNTELLAELRTEREFLQKVSTASLWRSKIALTASRWLEKSRNAVNASS